MIIVKGQVIAGVAQTLLDQVKAPATGAFANPDDVTSIVVTTFDMRTGEMTATTSLDVEDTVLDEPSLEYGWNEDDEGFNARIVVPGNHWPIGNRTYRCQIVYTYENGAPTIRIYELQCVEVFGA